MKASLACKLVATVLALATTFGIANAADPFPSGPVKIVVPAPPGGTADRVARMLGNRVSMALGQPVIMDYKPGASGLIAEEAVAKSAPNGLTLLIDHSVLAMNPVLQKSAMRFDIQDLRPVIQLVRYQHMLVVSNGLPARTLQEFVAYGKANPGKLNYATAGSGSPQHLMAEAFTRANGIRAAHVPYKGGAQQLTAVVTGEADFTFLPVPTAMEMVKGGKVRVLAVLDDARTRAFPDVPTFAELGYPGMASPWLGIFAPRGTPEPIVQRLYQEFSKALNEPEIKEWLAAESLQLMATSSAAFAQSIADEVASNEKLVKDWGLKVD